MNGDDLRRDVARCALLAHRRLPVPPACWAAVWTATGAGRTLVDGGGDRADGPLRVATAARWPAPWPLVPPAAGRGSRAHLEAAERAVAGQRSVGQTADGHRQCRLAAARFAEACVAAAAPLVAEGVAAYRAAVFAAACEADRQTAEATRRHAADGKGDARWRAFLRHGRAAVRQAATDGAKAAALRRLAGAARRTPLAPGAAAQARRCLVAAGGGAAVLGASDAELDAGLAGMGAWGLHALVRVGAAVGGPGPEQPREAVQGDYVTTLAWCTAAGCDRWYLDLLDALTDDDATPRPFEADPPP